MNNLQQLDEAISRLQTLRQALLHATTPPQVLWCRGGTYCAWVGTTHEAAYQDGEYHCPECGGAENLIIMSQAEAVEFMEECRSMATPWLAGIEQHLQAALDRVAAWEPALCQQHASADAFTLRPHTTAELEGLADAFAGAEADFLAQYQSTLCPYCGEETALITPAGRVVCACWTNPAQELVDELQGEAPVEGSHA